MLWKQNETRKFYVKLSKVSKSKGYGKRLVKKLKTSKLIQYIYSDLMFNTESRQVSGKQHNISKNGAGTPE